MTRSDISIDQRDAKRSLDDKPALIASRGSSVPDSDHGSQEAQLEKGAISDGAASDVGPSLSSADERKLLRRIDWRLLPLLAAMYVVKTIDAQNVSCPAHKLTR